MRNEDQSGLSARDAAWLAAMLLYVCQCLVAQIHPYAQGQVGWDRYSQSFRRRPVAHAHHIFTNSTVLRNAIGVFPQYAEEPRRDASGASRNRRGYWT